MVLYGNHDHRGSMPHHFSIASTATNPAAANVRTVMTSKRFGDGGKSLLVGCFWLIRWRSTMGRGAVLSSVCGGGLLRIMPPTIHLEPGRGPGRALACFVVHRRLSPAPLSARAGFSGVVGWSGSARALGAYREGVVGPVVGRRGVDRHAVALAGLGLGGDGVGAVLVAL